MEKEPLFASWHITDRCNFNCEYCPSHSTAPIKSPLAIEKMIKTLNKTQEKWTIGMTGGEPFLYPNFVELCKKLTKDHKIAIDTNLSLNAEVRKFADNIKPSKVYYIYVSTHIKERERRNGVKELIENLVLLKEKNFNIIVNYVLHPALIEKFKKDYGYFKSRGIELEPKPFKGKYHGKNYPEAYSDSEMELLLKYKQRAFLLVPFHSKGIKCNAGKTFIRIQMDGIVTRCVADKTIIGNILETIKLNENAEPCKINICPCFGLHLIKKPINSHV